MDLALLKWCLEKNPNFPVSLNSNLPTLKAVTSNYVVAGNLNVMHTARQVFIQNESSEKVKCALSHQIRTFRRWWMHYSDLVFYKREHNEQQHCPGIVTGQDGKQILVRVHTCRITHVINNDQN